VAGQSLVVQVELTISFGLLPGSRVVIARERTVSLNTLRTHTKNIYVKLDVNSPPSAVRRGQELDLFSRMRKA
jgi:DNA-binding CsgD family transcriptional regulator